MEPETENLAESRVAELEKTIAEKEAALNEANAIIAEMKDEATGQAVALASLELDRDKALERVSALAGKLKEAVAGYRGLALRENPGVPAEMVGGEDVAAIDESLARARSLVLRVREGLEAEVKKSRVPAGAPGRTGADFATLSAREKISYGVGRR